MRDSAASIVQPRCLLHVEGKDTFDFLHRMSTNDLRTLPDGEARRTVIVNEKGRVIDLVTVVNTGERAVLIGSPGAGNELARWFERFIIMDEVRIMDVLDVCGIQSIYGSDAPGLVRKLSVAVGFGDDRDDRIFPIPVEHGRILREDLGNVPGYLYVPETDFTAEYRATVFSGPDVDIPPADSMTFEMVRIEESVPVLGRELGADVNALEAGLKQYISFSKGCYIGQEVIARLDTYRRLQNILALFILPDYEGGVLSPGRVLQGDHEAGRITSTIYSPRHHAWIGLGYRRVQMKDTTFEFIPDLDDRKILCRCLSGLPNGYEQYEIQE